MSKTSKIGSTIRRTIAPSDMFEVNVSFAAKLKRIAIKMCTRKFSLTASILLMQRSFAP